MLDAEKTRIGLHKIIDDLEAQTGKKFAEMPWEFRDYVKAYARRKIDFGEINSGETLAKFLHEEIRIYMADKKVNEFADFKIDPKKYVIDTAWLEPLPVDRKADMQDVLNKELDKMRDSLPQMFNPPRRTFDWKGFDGRPLKEASDTIPNEDLVYKDDPLKDRPLTLPLLGKQELDKIDAIINLMHGDSKFKVSDIYHVAKIVHEENDELRKRIDAPRPAVEVKALTAEVGLIQMPWHDRLATDIKLARTIAVRGPAGNGKSTGVKGVLESAGYNIYHLDCNDSTTVDQLVGGLEPVPDGKGGIKMEFKDGVFAKAFKDEKGAIQLDEFDALDPRVTMSLQSALHRVSAGKKRMVSCPDHPVGVLYAVGDCPIIVTMNTWGVGATREYVGRNAIDAASLDRFDTIINTDYQCEAEMLEKMGLAATDRASLLREIFSLRKKIKDKGLRVLLSTRRVLNMGEAVLSLDCTVPAAISREFVERLDDYDRETLGLGLVK